jgi:hypothetical protein
MGLSPEGAEQRPDVYVQVPTHRESVFRAAVIHDGVPVADILQVWLDVSSHPARGEAQAEEIRHRVLAPIFEEKLSCASSRTSRERTWSEMSWL